MAQTSIHQIKNSTISTEEENLRAIHSDYYISEDIFAEEKEKLFFKSWQYVCHASELEEPGSYVATD
ncbi:MAG: hypothetical protein AAFX96_13545, partial [Pseudomonadota bacterium]